jgi:hypothetical protein
MGTERTSTRHAIPQPAVNVEEKQNMTTGSGSFAVHAAFALIVSILIAFDIIAAARSITNVDLTAADTLFIEP